MIIRTYNLNRHFLCSPLLFYMVVCPSLSPFTMMKITTYGGRHLSHIQPFLRLSRVLFRARTFCFSTRYPCRTERLPAPQFQICQAEILSSSGRVARKRRERKSFPLRGEWRASAERGYHFFYKSTMKVSPLGGIWNSMVKAFPLGKRKPAE